MANRRAILIRYAKVPNLGWRRGTLIRTKNGRIKPDYMVFKGEHVHCPQGKYEIRYCQGSKSVHKPVGSDLDVALAAFALFEKKLQYEALQEDLGIKMPELPKAERKTLLDLKDGYIEKYAHGFHDTIYEYTFAGTELTRVLTECGKTYPQQVTEDDVTAFDRYLEARGEAKSTRAHRYGHIRCFLRYAGLDPKKVISPEWNIRLRKKKPKLEPKAVRRRWTRGSCSLTRTRFHNRSRQKARPIIVECTETPKSCKKCSSKVLPWPTRFLRTTGQPAH